ncbi:hypothetical protein D9M71_742280 [compost metagenome]
MAQALGIFVGHLRRNRTALWRDIGHGNDLLDVQSRTVGVGLDRWLVGRDSGMAFFGKGLGTDATECKENRDSFHGVHRLVQGG